MFKPKKKSGASAKDEEKKARTLTEFKNEVQAKKKELPTFYKQLFYDRCMVCVYDFKMRDENFASCPNSFGIRPTSCWVRACKEFYPDPKKIAEIELKFSIKVTPFVQANWEHRDEDWFQYKRSFRKDLLTEADLQKIKEDEEKKAAAARAKLETT